MSRFLCLLLPLLLLASCSKSEADDILQQHSAGEEQPSVPSDVESIDTIPLDWDDATMADSLILPGTPWVGRWPRQYESWDGHLVVFVDSLSPRVAELTLLSINDWSRILSACSSQPSQAADTAAYYMEYGLSGWVIPSEAMARKMKGALNPSQMNAKLKTMCADTMRTKTGSSNARYLCEEAAKTFSLAANTNITAAGAKTQYRLRLLNTQRVARLNL